MKLKFGTDDLAVYLKQNNGMNEVVFERKMKELFEIKKTFMEIYKLNTKFEVYAIYMHSEKVK